MIPLRFETPLPWLIGWLPGQYAAIGIAGVAVRRKTPSPRPNRFILLRDDGGPRLAEVHRAHRVAAQVWATFEDGSTDWDMCNRMATELLFLFEKAAKAPSQIVTVLDSNGSYPVVDDSGVEYRYLTVDLQLRAAH